MDPSHVLAKYGLDVIAVTNPRKPAVQEQPLGTSVPVESDGQLAATHELANDGLDVIGATVPLKPAL